ncbi:hypothetical protein ACF1G0_17220 [Streptomyces sp. NPDC013953]|uniref:hypothetical protein n=1 Tax=Streptomyces sp. NPDC013953 TaxID=3364868 RepID=UPI003700E767
MLALIERRAAGGDVPVLFPPASWDPARQPLDDWMAERLARDCTGLGELAAGAPSGGTAEPVPALPGPRPPSPARTGRRRRRR